MVLDFSFEGNVGEFQCYKKCGVCQEVDEKELETIQALFYCYLCPKICSTSGTLNSLALAIVSSGIPRSYILLIIWIFPC